MTTLRHIVTFLPKPGAAPAVETFDRVRPKPLTTRGIVKLLQTKHPKAVFLGVSLENIRHPRKVHVRTVPYTGRGKSLPKVRDSVHSVLVRQAERERVSIATHLENLILNNEPGSKPGEPANA